VKGLAGVRLAVFLWLVFALVVWNVIFDRVLVLAGRRYAWQAYVAAQTGTYLRIDDAMPLAIRHGVRVATLWAGLLAAAGLVAVAFAARIERNVSSD
jgi:hypothetical protein